MAGCFHRWIGLGIAGIGVAILINGSYIIGGILVGVGLLFVLEGLARRQRLTKPRQIAPYVVEHFEKVTEKEISSASQQIMRVDPDSPERSLLYALRVSKCVPGVKTFKTLASRWETAYSGAGGHGLRRGEDSPNWQMTYDFLAGLYVRRFDQLCAEAAEKARATAAKRKTAKAKSNALTKGAERIDAARLDFVPEFPGLDDVADRWIDALEAEADALDA